MPSPRRLRSKLDLKFFSLKHGRVAASNIIVDDSGDTHIHEKVPPPPPPKDDAAPARQYRPSWQELYTAFEVSSSFARTPSPDTPAASQGAHAGEHTQTIFLARPLRHQSNLSGTSSGGDSALDASFPSSPSPPTIMQHPPPHRNKQTTTTTTRIPVPAGRLPLAPRRHVASTPDELELRRREARRLREQEERQAQREYAERQARLKREKEEVLRQHLEEERQRKAELAEELARIADQRRKKAAMEREAEELKRMLAAEKRRVDRERRIQETQKHQAWRAEHAQREAEIAQRREGLRQEMLEQRQAIASRLRRSMMGSPSEQTVLLSGWITVQLEESAAWKRRFYQLNEKALTLFKSAEETHEPLEVLPRSGIRRTREYQDGYEELEGIAHSFAVELKNGVSNWHVFLDSEQDKEYLLALLDAK